MQQDNIILLVLDSLSAARLSCYGYERTTTPNIDDFASDSLVYRNAFANSSWTVPTHGTLFTGLYPSEHGANAKHKRLSIAPEHTLAGKLSEAGYQSFGLSANPWVSTNFGYDIGFDEFEDKRLPLPVSSTHPRELLQHLDDKDIDGVRVYSEALKWTLKGNPIQRAINLMSYKRNSESYATARIMNERIEAWLDRFDDGLFFMFANFMDVHEPYNPDSEYLSEFREGRCQSDIAWHLRSLNETYSESELKCINDKYDACLKYLDEQIGRLLDGLESRGILDETTIIITSDHGKCLGEHEYMGVGTFLYDELVRVPLIVSPAESLEPVEELDSAVSHVDVHDLILKAATGEAPERPEFDGVVSETLGPHQAVTVDAAYVPSDGLRRIDYDGQTMIRDKESSELIVAPDSGDLDHLEQIEQTFLDTLDLSLVEFDGDREELMDEEVQSHLKELGYL